MVDYELHIYSSLCSYLTENTVKTRLFPRPLYVPYTKLENLVRMAVCVTIVIILCVGMHISYVFDLQVFSLVPVAARSKA